MKMTKFKDGNYLDGSNRLDTPEERISELEYLQKPSKMDRGRKETRRKEEKQHTSWKLKQIPGKGVWKGRRKTTKYFTFNVNYECMIEDVQQNQVQETWRKLHQDSS